MEEDISTTQRCFTPTVYSTVITKRFCINTYIILTQVTYNTLSFTVTVQNQQMDLIVFEFLNSYLKPRQQSLLRSGPFRSSCLTRV